MSARSSTPGGARRDPAAAAAGWVIAGAVALCGCGCLPSGSTPLRRLSSAVRPFGSASAPRPLDRVMVATLAPRAVVLATGAAGLTVAAPRDDHGPGLVRAVARLRLARAVIPSPLSRARRPELRRAAQDARAALLVTSQVVDVRLRSGANARYAGLVLCALTVGMTLVGIPACMAIPAHTLEAEVELELTIWDVGQRRRVWQHRLRRRGHVSVSSYTARRAAGRAMARGANMAYRAALPRIARALAALASARAQNSGVKR